MAEPAEVVATGDAVAAAADPAVNQGFFSIAKGLIIRALMIYFITSFFRRSSTPDAGTSDLSTSDPTSGIVRLPATNLYDDSTRMDLYAYLSDLEDVDDQFPEHLLWRKRGLVYGDWTSGPEGDGSFSASASFQTSEALRNNGSVFLHVYLVRSGNNPNPDAGKNHHKLSTVHVVHRLNKYMKLRYKKTANLITGQTEKSDEEVRKAETVKEEIVSHWHPNLTINVVHDFTQWTLGAVPAPLQPYVQFTPAQDMLETSVI